MQKYQDVVLNQNGNVVVGAQITVRTLAGDIVPVYGANNTSSPDINPLTTDTLGRFAFYAPDGRYNLSVSLAGAVVATVTDILLEDPLDGSDAVFGDVTVTGNLEVQGGLEVGDPIPSAIPDGAVTAEKIDPAYDATLVKLAGAQTITGPKRGQITANASLTFDLAVTNNFSRTTSGAGTLNFTNITAGQSGFILLDNSGGHTISAAATTKVSASFLAAVSTAGVYLLSYFSNGTNVYVVASEALV
jgi:hypothetical protein